MLFCHLIDIHDFDDANDLIEDILVRTSFFMNEIRHQQKRSVKSEEMEMIAMAPRFSSDLSAGIHDDR